MYPPRPYPQVSPEARDPDHYHSPNSFSGRSSTMGGRGWRMAAILAFSATKLGWSSACSLATGVPLGIQVGGAMA